MKKTLTILILLLASLNSIQAESKNADIEIIIDGIKEKKGKIMVALHNEKKGFPGENRYKEASIPADANITAIVFENIPPGTYAFAIFQDKNDNGKLDKGAFGIPKEPTAFSNNARRKTGPAKFNKAKFNHNNTLTKQTITIK